jgi:Tfp pilus assembly protein PilN
MDFFVQAGNKKYTFWKNKMSGDSFLLAPFEKLEKLRNLLTKLPLARKILAPVSKTAARKIKKTCDELITALFIKENQVKWSISRKTKQKYEWLKSSSSTIEPALDSTSKEEITSPVAKIIEENISDFEGCIVWIMPSNRILMQILDFPTKEIDELEGMVQLQVDKSSPYPPDETVFSYESLYTFEQNTRVLLSIMRKNNIDEIKSLMDGIGLNIQRIDIEPLALWYVLNENSSVPQAGRHFFICLSIAGGVLLCSEDGKLSGCKNILPLKDLTREEIASDLEEELQNIIIAMELSHGVKPIEGICIHAELSEAEYIKESFRKKFPSINFSLKDEEPDAAKAALERFLIFQNNQKLKKKKSTASYVIPLLDFVPEEWRKAASESVFRRRLFKASLLLLGVWLLAVSCILGLYSFEQKKTNELSKESSSLSAPANEVRMLQQRVKEFERYIDRSKSLLDYLLEITKVMPQEVILTSFQYAKDRSVTIRGESLTANPILDFKQALDKSTLFTSVDMGNIMPAKRKDTTVQSFQITIHLEEKKVIENTQNKSQKTSGAVKIGSSSGNELEMEGLK